ncbi:MAG: biopolymer transporter ExbD [Endomicrobium sp.]|jgi:biopolymer transport protein ExbD|nr:biopolymer transporter ExbD [Endomicrobium sp.]
MLYIRKSKKTISEINIVPFIDIVLVLLIIFMLTTFPVFTYPHNVQLCLPEVELLNYMEEKNQNSSIEVMISENGNIYINGKNVSNFDVKYIISNLIIFNSNKSIVIKADKKVKYNHILRFINEVKDLGKREFVLTVKKKD